MDLGLFFFSSGPGTDGQAPYDRVLELVDFAEQHDFGAVWIPERHFNQFGYLFPNPMVLLAALSQRTQRIQLRTGSLVLPLHQPIRVAEDLAMIDNLSGGRLGVAVGSGWHPNDFALRPEAYADRRNGMLEAIDTIRRLWREETITAPGGDGKPLTLQTYPAPRRRNIPIWLSAAGAPETFERAGAIGANLLTHLLLSEPDELAHKIRIYRESLARHGYDPQSRKVAVWVLTHLGHDAATARAEGIEALTEYVRTDGKMLFRGFAYHHKGRDIHIDQLGPQEFRDYAGFLGERLIRRNMAIFGSLEQAQATALKLRELGVDELACQVDFVGDVHVQSRALPLLAELRETLATHTEQAAPTSATELSLRVPVASGIASRPDRDPELWLDGETLYERYAKAGLGYGPGFRHIRKLKQTSSGAVCILEPGIDAPRATVLDAILHSAGSALPDVEASTVRFAAVDALQLPDELPGRFTVEARLRDEVTNDARVEYFIDLQLSNDQGHVLGHARGVRFAAVAAGETDITYRREWQASSLLESVALSGEEDSLHNAVGSASANDAGSGPGREFVVDGQRVPVLYLADVASLAGQRAESLATRTLAWVQGLIRDNGDSSAPIKTAFLVTRGATTAHPSSGVTGVGIDPRQAAARAVAKVAQLEHPEIAWQLVDLPATEGSASTQKLHQLLHAPVVARSVAIRDESCFEETLIPEPPPAATPPLLRRDSAYVVTGALGGLGQALCGFLARRNAGVIIAVCRRANDPRANKLRVRLADSGCELHTVAADVSEGATLHDALAKAESESMPIRGIFHLAGRLSDGVLLEQGDADFAATFGPKADAVDHLDAFARQRQLDAFVCFSSAAALYGSPGQASYSAANAYIDAVCANRHAQNQPALSINWGAWSGAGMAGQLDATLEQRAATFGMHMLAPGVALAAMERWLGAPTAQVAIMKADWGQVAEQFRHQVPPILRSLARPPAKKTTALSGVSQHDLPQIIGDFVVRELESLLGEPLPPDQRDVPLQQLGLDSLLAIDLKNRLFSELELSLSLVAFMEDLAINELIQSLVDEALRSTDTAERESPPEDQAASDQVSDTQSLLDRLDELDAAQIEQLLARAEVSP